MTEKRRKWTYYGVVIFLIIISLIFFIKYRSKLVRIILPFLLAMIIAYLAEKPVMYIESISFGRKKRKIKRSWAILLVYLAFLIFITAILMFIIPAFVDNLKELLASFPNIYEKVNSIGKTIMEFFESREVPQEIINIMEVEFRHFIESFEKFGVRMLSNILSSIGETISIFFDCLLSFLIAFYFLKDKKIIVDALLSLFPYRWRNTVLDVVIDINRIISSFVSGQLFVAFIVGVIETIGLFIIGVKYPILLGIVGGISNIIPIIGPFFGAIPAVAFALLDSPLKAFIVAVFFLVVQQFDNNILTPRIVEGRLGLHPVATIAIILISGILYGLAGVLISVPIAAIIVSVFSRILRAVSRNSPDN